MEKLQIVIEEWGLYNNGILACKWWNCDADMEEIRAYYSNLKEENGLEYPEDLELFCADWENDVLNIVSENCNIEEAFKTYNNLDLNEDEIEVLTFLTDCQGYELKEALENIEDTEVYDCSNFKELTEQFVEEGLMGEIPANLINYLDYEAIGNDLFLYKDLKLEELSIL